MSKVLKEVPSELEQALDEMSESVGVKAGGKVVTVTVKPFRLRQFAQVLKCVQRLRDGGVIEEKALKDIAEADDAQEAVKRFDMVKMFLDGGDEIINILQIAVGKGQQLTSAAVDDLDLMDGARLASAVFAVNLDFFYQNREAIQGALAPALKAVDTVVSEGVEALGQAPSTDSEGQDTA
ncbi:MAG TPA: hypothetical protein VF521_10210 [Pyrinomonadaceae bacterium]|jgi:hypothetical protein